MNRLLVCRVCLAYDTRLCSIMDGLFLDIYEKLVDASFVTEDMLPTSVCFICFSSMKKMLQFRERSQKSNQILQQMINKGLEPSISTLDMLVKAQTGISWNLGMSKIESTTTTSVEIELIEAPVKLESIKAEMDVDETSERHEGAVKHASWKIDANQAENEVVNIKTEKVEETIGMEEDEKEIPDLTKGSKKFKAMLNEAKTSNIISEEQNNGAFNDVDTVTHTEDIFTCDLNVTNEFKSASLLKLQEDQNNDKRKENLIRKDSPFQYECQYCRKRFAFNCHLTRHLEVHTKEVQNNVKRKENPRRNDNPSEYECQYCMKRFAFNCHLTRHLKVHTKEKSFKCGLCGKSFAEKGNLTKHLRVHAKEKRFKCDICEKGFYERQNLTRHIAVHTKEKPFKCDLCKRGFSLKTDLKMHSRVHAKENPFKCDICDKGVSRKSELIIHLRVHSKEKPFKCDKCERAFSQSSHLKDHLKLHIEEKPFKCKICGRGFARKDVMMVHLRVHTQEKPYKCDLCDKAFSRNSGLIVHLRNHSNEKPFKCGICERGFTRKECMKKHLKRAHK